MHTDPLTRIEQLLTATRDGDRQAIGPVLQACRNYLLLVANSELEAELRAKGGASDLVQETFLNAQREFDRFRGRSAEELLGWLRAILLNSLANFRRRYRATARRQIEREVPLAGLDPHPELNEALVLDTPSPCGRIIRQEQVQALGAALARLPEHYRQAIVWRHQDNQPFEEIGRRLDRSPDAARMLWVRAVAQLQQELEAQA